MEQMINSKAMDIAARYERACRLEPVLGAKDVNPFQGKEEMAPPAGAMCSDVSAQS